LYVCEQIPADISEQKPGARIFRFCVPFFHALSKKEITGLLQEAGLEKKLADHKKGCYTVKTNKCSES
jgi:hypothetical protein